MTLKAVIKICPQGNSWQFYNQFLLPFQACFLLKIIRKGSRLHSCYESSINLIPGETYTVQDGDLRVPFTHGCSAKVKSLAHNSK